MNNSIIFAGSTNICDIQMNVYCNHIQYKEYLCELLHLQDVKLVENTEEICFVQNSELIEVSEDYLSDNVFVIREQNSINVQEQRKCLKYDSHKLQCEINVKVKSSEALYYTYVLPALRIVLAENGIFCLHGSAFMTPSGKCIAFVAPSGCGKSTLSVLLMKHHCTILTDDLFFIDVKRSRIATFKRPAHIDINLCKSLPWLEEWLCGSSAYMAGSKKYNLKFFDKEYISYSDSMPLPQRIFFPIIANEYETSLMDISFRGAMMRILSQMYFHVDKNDDDVVQFLAAHCTKAKVLRLGTGLLENPLEVEKLLQKVEM